jgi:hypothetical protein
LTHNGVVIFSVGTNRRFRHKIVLDRTPGMAENRWLGVTFRTSKTLVRFRDGQTLLPDGTRRENTETDFTYPRLTYTISDSDLTPPA